MKPTRKFLAVTAAGLFASASFAQTNAPASAADLLMQAAAPQAPAAKGATITAGVGANEPIVLNTPIARAVFAEWNSSRNQAGSAAFEIETWSRLFLAEKFEATTHLWGVVSAKAPDAFIDYARAAHLYSLYRIGVNQTFFDMWMSALNSEKFAKSPASLALEESITANFEQWFLASNLQISSDAEAVINRLGPNRSLVFLTLAAVTHERKGSSQLQACQEIIEKLPLNSALRPRLAQTIAVALARKNDLAGAARVFKSFYEPWLATAKDASKTSSYYMQIARLLYQAGSFDGARQYYEKIPNGSADYLTAREELTWVWLRLGESEKLRGNLRTLTSSLLEDKFQPEAYLVRAISNLKLCYHGEVEKDFAEFLRVNQRWAGVIGQNLKLADPAVPRTADYYSQRAVAAEKAREVEVNQLKSLSERSIAAVLPAVGPQKHWLDALQRASLNVEAAKKNRVAEYRRQWKNDQSTLTEAIRKMQFVKVELMSQMALLSANSETPAKSETGAAAVAKASGVSVDLAKAKAKIANDGDMVFPFDGVVWPDELFKLRAQASSQCLGHM